MIDRFRKYIAGEKLFTPRHRILLAVSGGMDSVVMCTMFRLSGIPFVVAHCNFGLRGKASDGDEKFVRRLATEYGVACHAISLDAQGYASDHKISIQEAARDLRYAWFEKIRKAARCQRIATAHHLDDSMETFFINLLRGSGPDGLKGIPARNGHVVRPLLFATRAELAAWAKEMKLRWREDASNAGDDYFRNVIRHKLIPLLRQIQPAVDKAMQTSMSHLGETAKAVQQWVEQAVGPAVKKSRQGMTVDLHSLPEEWRGFLLYRLLRDKGFTRMQADAMASPSRLRAAGQVFTGKGYEALRDRNLVIVRKQTRTKNKAVKLERRDKNLLLPDTTWKVQRLPAMGFRLPKKAAMAVLDAGKLRFPLTVRRWKAGDAFYPLGMKGRKKVSDFLIDSKISRFEKENIFVILSGNDLVCILGHRIDDRYKITKQSKQLLLLEAEPHD